MENLDIIVQKLSLSTASCNTHPTASALSDNQSGFRMVVHEENEHK